jgi:Skp family chaperone for outer membrane proteins
MLKTSVALPLARMELNNIGQESDTAKVVSEIFNEIVEAVVKTVASAKIEGLNVDVLTKDLPNAAKGIGKDITKDIKKTINGLF